MEKVFSKIQQCMIDGSHALNIPDTMAPIGVVICTCEKYPHVVCMNNQMKTYLGNFEKESSLSYEDNVYLIIPYEDRPKVKNYLDSAIASSKPIRITHQLIQPNGKFIKVNGWLGKIKSDNDESLFSFVYTSIDENQFDNSILSNPYFKALESAYNIIFEFNRKTNTVKCIYGRTTSDIGNLFDINMTLDSALNFWVNNYVIDEDKVDITKYLETITSLSFTSEGKDPLQTEFRVKWTDDMIYSFIGVGIKLSDTSTLFCMRDTANVQFSSLQAREVRALKRLHSHLDSYFSVVRGALGAIIFEKNSDDHCAIIYTSQDILKFLGLREDQHIHNLENGVSISEMKTISKYRGLDNIEDLFTKGSLTQYVDVFKTDVTITLNKLAQETYEILVKDKNLQATVAGIPQHGVFARTFGYFDLFVDGTPVIFAGPKEKELLALLIDRNGGTLSTNDAVSILWEDEPIDDKSKAKYRKTAMGLNRTLKQYNIEDLVTSNNGVRHINTTKLICDYYELLNGNPAYTNSFHNNYMTDYSWGETTLGTLWDYS